MSKEDQEHVFQVVAAVLWLGNISFQVIDSEDHVKIVADEGISLHMLRLGSTLHIMVVRGRLAIPTYNHF